jgi:hypothetical protein
MPMDPTTKEARRKYRAREPLSYAEEMAFHADNHDRIARQKRAELRRLARIAAEGGAMISTSYFDLIAAGVGTATAWKIVKRRGFLVRPN